MKEKIIEKISGELEDLFAISRFLYDNPELGSEEHKAEKILTDYLTRNGFTVEHGVYELDTAFRATYDSGKPGAVIGFFCEYDALPEMGHGCGHDLIASMSLGAAIGLKSALNETGGKIIVFGTPAEETNGAKCRFAERGAFDGITAALMAHPNAVSEESGTSMALHALEFEFFGKTAHAAAAPEKGINALDAVILLYNGINAIRQHLTSDVRIHGIISSGGTAPNVVPDYAAAKFYIRAANKENHEVAIRKVRDCAHGAEMMTGAKVKITKFENAYDNMRTNRTLSDAFTKNLRAAGEKLINPPSNGIGSIDMGNVSQVAPAIHAWIGMGNPDLIIHSKEFADFTMTDKGKETLFRGACALAATGYDIITSEELQKKIKEEFLSSAK